MSRTHNSNSVGYSWPNQMATRERRSGPIEYRPIGEIHVCKNNPRKHPEKQNIKFMASIRHFGFAIPALIDNDRTIIAGEARIEAARHLGMPGVPALVAEERCKAQIQAYRIADNKLSSQSTWDVELLAIEFAEIFELDEIQIELTVMSPDPRTCLPSE